MTDLALALTGAPLGFQRAGDGGICGRRRGGTQRRAAGKQQPGGAEQAEAQGFAPGQGQTQGHAQ